jgi:hypothetical protein
LCLCLLYFLPPLMSKFTVSAIALRLFWYWWNRSNPWRSL